MMKRVIISVFFILLITVIVEGAVFQYPNAKHPDHPGKCYDESTDTLLDVGESLALEGQCTQITCYEGSHITGASCGSVVPREGCKNVIDVSKPYPECCYNLVCSDGKKE